MKNRFLRMCVACRIHKPKQELIRIVTDNKKIFVDKTQKINSRGFYLCNNIDCYHKALKNKIFNNILKCSVCEDDLKDIESNINK